VRVTDTQRKLCSVGTAACDPSWVWMVTLRKAHAPVTRAQEVRSSLPFPAAGTARRELRPSKARRTRGQPTARQMLTRRNHATIAIINSVSEGYKSPRGTFRAWKDAGQTRSQPLGAPQTQQHSAAHTQHGLCFGGPWALRSGAPWHTKYMY